ncbi:MAG: DUF3006 domain-containing protein [Syntrophomonadaceae bacterium]|nr:DUF3006 domain-containing protein [Syntrophomonadaceae bacterium]MDD3890134.1 DUF3006 domain-containing protein [Syntrophomonadaceae bacterium]MDD4548332.1 DUF3006 domain-containing protein [Syntrophomonadaceae bacterium]
MIAILDRFEGQYAILEIEDKIQKIDRQLVPEQAREGDVLVYHNNEWVIDTRATLERKEKITKLAEKLWED